MLWSGSGFVRPAVNLPPGLQNPASSSSFKSWPLWILIAIAGSSFVFYYLNFKAIIICIFSFSDSKQSYWNICWHGFRIWFPLAHSSPTKQHCQLKPQCWKHLFFLFFKHLFWAFKKAPLLFWNSYPDVVLHNLSHLIVLVYLRVLDVVDSSRIEIHKGGISVFIYLLNRHTSCL